MLSKAGPILSRLALDEIETKRQAQLLDVKKTQAEIAGIQAETSKTFEAIRKSQQEEELLPAGSEFRTEGAERIVDAVNDLRARTNNQTTGIGATFTFIPGSVQKNFAADLTFLKSNIGFSVLQAMREASKTGGALGQVSERELEFLNSALGALDQKQSPENFKKNLDRIEQSVNRWLGVAGGGLNDLRTKYNY